MKISAAALTVFSTSLAYQGENLTQENQRKRLPWFRGQKPLALDVPSFICTKTAQNARLIDAVKDLDYKPFPWVSSEPVVQMAIGLYVPSASDVKFHVEYVPLSDGGQLSLFWEEECYKKDDTKAILVISPGVTGGAEADYIRDLCKQAAAKGYKPVVAHHRGVNCALTTPKMYHPGASEDFGSAVEYIHKKNPSTPLVGIGISMGGNIVLKYAGEHGTKSLLKAIAGISVPFNFRMCTERIQEMPYLNYLISYYVKKNIRENHLDFLRKFEEELGLDLQLALSTNISLEMENALSAKIYNVDDILQFYDEGSCYRTVDKIAIPTYCLHTLDDPICIKECIPYDKIKANPNIIMRNTMGGGHIDFYSGTFIPRRWWPVPALAFLDEAVEMIKEGQF